MKFQYILFLFFFFILKLTTLSAQHTFVLSKPEHLWIDGMELFQKEKYAAAQRLFLDYLAYQKKDEWSIHAEYYAAACAMHLGNADFEQKMLAFVAQYPVHPQSKKAFQDLGLYYFSKGEHAKSVAYLEKVVNPNPIESKDIEICYKLAFSYFQTKKYKKATPLFNSIKFGDHEYSSYSSYYAGYLAYLDNDFEGAIDDLDRASRNPALKKETIVLIPAIYYKRGECHRVLEFVNDLKKESEKFPADIFLLVGDCYYSRNQYPEAAENFLNYAQLHQKTLDRNVSFRIGYSCFWNENYNSAANYLNTSADGQDSLAQVSAYYLGITHVKIGKKIESLAAFDKARRLDFLPELAELSAYYFVQVSYDLQDFRTCLEGSDFYIRNFTKPNEERLEDVKKIQTQSYRYSGDYEAAMRAIENLSNKDLDMRRAYQQITYNMGVLYWNDNKYNEAMMMFYRSLNYRLEDSIVVKARYALGEIYSLLERYDSAIALYNKVKPEMGETPQWKYSMAYSLYNRIVPNPMDKAKDYSAAIPLFYDYILQNQTSDRNKVLDAIVRMGDCYQANREYDKAHKSYDLAIKSNTPIPDYVFLQKGITYKAQNEINDAIEFFDQVIETRKSPYRDEAIFRKAEIHFEDGRKRKSIDYFTQLIEESPQGRFLLKAYSKRALACIPDDYTQAISDYKQIIKLDASSEEAKDAVKSLVELFDQGIDVGEDFDSYIEQYEKINPDRSASIGRKFNEAKKPFNDGNYDVATQTLSAFIKQYPQPTPYLNEALFLLGYSYELHNNQKEEALPYYLQIKEGEYKERATKNIADIYYELEDYEKSTNYYTELRKYSSNKRSEEVAMVGLMRSLFQLDDFEGSMIEANRIIQSKIKKYQNEAHLYKGKVYLEEKNYDAAIAKFDSIALIANDKIGAEAQYLIGRAYRELGEDKLSTDALIQVRKRFDAYPEWIYEAFLLIAENYIDANDIFQAKATLNSIIQYSKIEKYKQKAEQRLLELEKKQSLQNEEEENEEENEEEEEEDDGN